MVWEVAVVLHCRVLKVRAELEEIPHNSRPSMHAGAFMKQLEAVSLSSSNVNHKVQVVAFLKLVPVPKLLPSGHVVMLSGVH